MTTKTCSAEPEELLRAARSGADAQTAELMRTPMYDAEYAPEITADA